MQPGRLGKYTLTAVLGEGAMGTVYKGIDPLIHRPVAVKVIRKHLFDVSASKLTAAQRFRNEAQAAGRLSHPGIVGVYEYGEDNGDPFIAMEYVEGTSLSRYMALPDRLPEPDMLSVMAQLLDALHYAHEQGVWHRDIKPNNIIITPDGRVKIADFGIARIESSAPTQIQTTMLIGSPGYIAPERYTGDTPPDRRVDIFSCGALLYHLLTGKSPFSGTDSEVMYKVLQLDPTPPSQSGAWPTPARCYDAIVAKALAKRPDDRYATAKELRDALTSVAVLPIGANLSRAALHSVVPGASTAACRSTEARRCCAGRRPCRCISCAAERRQDRQHALDADGLGYGDADPTSKARWPGTSGPSRRCSFAAWRRNARICRRS